MSQGYDLPPKIALKQWVTNMSENDEAQMDDEDIDLRALPDPGAGGLGSGGHRLLL